jgi:serine/threonine-protein kinase
MTPGGRYLLGDEIAQGGMAAVHHAVDTVLNRHVAIKIVKPERSTDRIYRDAVRREALSAARLTHPNVVRVLDYGEMEISGHYLPFVVMELLRGRTLAARLHDNGPLPWREAARICIEVAHALATAHAHNVVHRDIKPSNIMIGPRGVKILDFGVSAGPGVPSIDDDGRVWGTPAYFAPEQLHGEAAGPAADVFAMGLVLHACLTGRPAWTGTSFRDIAVARALSPIPRLPEDCDVPDAIADVHRRCLRPRPRKRPSARDVGRRLHAAFGSDPRTSAAERAQRDGHRRILPVAVDPDRRLVSRLDLA